MPAPLDCPAIDSWRALLGDTVPPERRQEYERHLESCPACQDRLDRAEDCAAALRQLGWRAGDPTAAPPDPTLAAVMERLQEGEPPSAGGAADLYFLRPSERPGVLGTLGEYEVLEVVGQGGMGVVLKALDPALNRYVAIKVLAAAVAGSATARLRFTREARAAAAVCHDHVVPVHGVHEADGLPYLVMQYVAGESLQERIDRLGPLAVEEVVRIGHQAAAGLAAAHAQGLIHRDIKPANLLLEAGVARVKITDFGLARMADDAGLTRDGVVAGTPEYMAPEQARSEPVDPRADLYSLGAVLYACCTGRPPFRGVGPLAVLRRVTDEAPPSVRSLNPRVPEWLERLIGRLLAKDPTDRFPSAAEVAALLEGYLGHLRQPEAAPAPALPPAPAGTPARRGGPALRFGGLLLALALAALGLGGVAWLAPGGGPGAQGQSSPDGFYQDFRDEKPLVDPFFLMGTDWEEYIAHEREGLRVNLPATRKVQRPMRGIGLAANLSVAGDFQITATYELLSAGTPVSSSEVAGVDLYVQHARFGRFNTQEGPVYGMRAPSSGQRVPTAATKGQLRLARTGSLLLYLVKDDTTQGEFKELYRTEFGTEPLKFLLFEVNPGREATPVEARLIDLRIESNLQIQAPAQPALAAAAGGPGRRAKGWLTAAGIIGLLTALAFVGVWLVARRSRRARTPRTDTAPRPAAAAPLLAVTCPGCGHGLKVKAERAGKKGKCPKCGGLVVVPGPA